jgi:hypothetical protein
VDRKSKAITTHVIQGVAVQVTSSSGTLLRKTALAKMLGSAGPSGVTQPYDSCAGVTLILLETANPYRGHKRMGAG